VQQAASERLLLQYTTSTHTLKHTGTQASTLENECSAERTTPCIQLFFSRPCVAHDEM